MSDPLGGEGAVGLVDEGEVDQVEVEGCAVGVELYRSLEGALGFLVAEVPPGAPMVVQLAEQDPRLGVVGIAVGQDTRRVDPARVKRHQSEVPAQESRFPAGKSAGKSLGAFQLFSAEGRDIEPPAAQSETIERQRKLGIRRDRASVRLAGRLVLAPSVQLLAGEEGFEPLHRPRRVGCEVDASCHPPLQQRAQQLDRQAINQRDHAVRGSVDVRLAYSLAGL